MCKRLFLVLSVILSSGLVMAKTPADSTTSKRMVGKNNASIYPNPTDGDIKIQNLPFDKGSIEVCTLQGKVVKNVQIDKNSDLLVSLQDLLSQPYIIKIKASDGTAATSSKVIVKQ